MATPSNMAITQKIKERNSLRGKRREARIEASVKANLESSELADVLNAVKEVHVHLALNKETRDGMSYDKLFGLFAKQDTKKIGEVFEYALQNSIAKGTAKALESGK